MQSGDKPTITIGQDFHESESNENHVLNLFKEITQEDMQNASEMPLDLSIKNRNYEKTKISNQQSSNFQAQSLMPNLFLPSTSANFSPLTDFTCRPNNISSASSSASMVQTGNIRARPSDSRRKRILYKYQRSDKQTFACDICSQTFKRNFVLKRHKIKHMTERTHSCDECQKTFKRKSHLIRHKKEHSNERRFACEICNKTFKRSLDVKKHQGVHSDKRPFTCEICYKSFKQSSHLYSHQIVHSDKRSFECLECTKSFKRKSELENHKIEHTDERYFWCDQCNKKFKHKSSLYKHQKKHS